MQLNLETENNTHTFSSPSERKYIICKLKWNIFTSKTDEIIQGFEFLLKTNVQLKFYKETWTVSFEF